MIETDTIAKNQTMRVFSIVAVFLFTLTIIQSVAASVYLKDGSEVFGDSILNGVANSSLPDNPFPFHFFYDHQCQSCQNALEYLHAVEKKNSNISIEYHNFALDKANQNLYSQYKSQFHNKKMFYPTLFLGNVALSGSTDIIHYTEPLANLYMKMWIETKSK